MRVKKLLRIRVLRTFQKGGFELYSFFIPGSQILRIARISRVHRDEESQLHGFQRKEVRTHVRQIIDYLDGDKVLFPNAVILCMSSEVVFKLTRGRPPRGLVKGSDSGFLEIPLYEEGEPVAWIVDGQQRSLALSQTNNHDIQVPVVAFISNDIAVQREQFIIVNKAKPLSSRLINELLPEVSAINLPRDLAPRRLPSELCTLLNQDTGSPFHELIRQVSTTGDDKAVVTDTAIINMIRRSIKNPLGALSPYKTSFEDGTDIAQMYKTILMFWRCVKEAFPEAWGKPPTESRLMHSAGIEALGFLMDRLVTRTTGMPNPEVCIRDSLVRIAPYCHWTEGRWNSLSLNWNDIQNTGKHIKMLADTLVQLDFRLMDRK